jgi:rod shape determining protein RodA
MQISWNQNDFFHLDRPLLLGLLIITVLGLVILYSASGQNVDMVLRQSVRISMGFAVLIILAQVRPQSIMTWVPWIYGIGLLMLIAVLLIGDVAKGSQRWLNFGLIRFQPSELMKLAVPLMVSWYLSDKSLPPNLQRIVVSLLITLTPALLVAKQPDLGTALLITASGVFVLLLSGLYWQLIAVSLALVPVIIWGLWQVMYDYQKQRVLTLLNPEGDPLGAGYHIIQSKIAIGSGGLYGKGWLNGTQSHLEFLPERSTDFIFAVFSEEFGLIGVLILLSLYFFILTRGMMIALQAQGNFARLLAGSLVLTFFVYIFVNMGMVSGLLPVVGVPLPLISYGGTSIVTLMAAFGLLMGVHTHKRLLSG